MVSHKLKKELEMSENNFIIVKVAGAPTGVFYEVEAVARFIYNADPTKLGVLGPFVEQAQKMMSEKVAEWSAANGCAAPEGAIIDILVQLMPVIIQMLPVLLALCPK